MGQRIVEWYHGMFHLAQVTIHDRWVKRLRLIAFLAASSIATQIVLLLALGQVGMGNVLPSSLLTILVASALPLSALPPLLAPARAGVAGLAESEEGPFD